MTTGKNINWSIVSACAASMAALVSVIVTGVVLPSVYRGLDQMKEMNERSIRNEVLIEQNRVNMAANTARSEKWQSDQTERLREVLRAELSQFREDFRRELRQEGIGD